MKNTFRKLLGIGAVAAASILPLQRATAQNSSPDTTKAKTEQVQEDKFSMNVTSDLAHKSRFWGLPFLNTPHYKQAFGVDYGNFTASVIGNVDVKEHKLFDVDTHVGYSQSLGSKLSSHFGYLNFVFDLGEGIDWAGIAYAGLSANVPLNPSITYNKVFRFGGGHYIEGAVSESADLAKNTTLDITGKVGWNKNALREGTGFTHLEGIASVPITTGNWKITPRLNFFYTLCPKDVKTGVIAGLNASVEF